MAASEVHVYEYMSMHVVDSVCVCVCVCVKKESGEKAECFIRFFFHFFLLFGVLA